jgi:hypothetical protein
MSSNAQALTSQQKASLGLPQDDLIFWYPINVVLTALQANLAGNVQIDNDADFECRWFISSQTGLYSTTLVDRLRTRPLMPSNINSENLAGTAQLPFILPKPLKLMRTAVIAGQWTDRSNAGNTIQFCFAGYKLNL